jgi:predicted urease superfamily metal-dependent hydrolase
MFNNICHYNCDRLSTAKSITVMPTVMMAIVLNSLVVELRNAGYKLETDFVEEPKRVYHQGLKINNE